MKRFGYLTGKIYETEEEAIAAKECTRIITDELDPILYDKDHRDRMHEMDLLFCETCRGCPASVEGPAYKTSANMVRATYFMNKTDNNDFITQ